MMNDLPRIGSSNGSVLNTWIASLVCHMTSSPDAFMSKPCRSRANPGFL
jgi:hypothetical protein